MGPAERLAKEELYITNFVTSSVPEEYAVVVLRGSLVLATFTFRTS